MSTHMETIVDFDDGQGNEPVKWIGIARVDKFEGEVTAEQIERGEVTPYDTFIGTPNLLLIGGASALWERLVGTAITAFDNANAYIGVGDSTTAAVDTQTDLVAATNKLRVAMDATYPQHTDSTSSNAAKTITFKSTFSTAQANFAWQEWGVFNATSAGRMLNRKVESLGTKTSAATWALTVTISMA
jgi:hypothetical protein